MMEAKLPDGWCVAQIADISVKCEQRKPDSNEIFTYIDIGSINRDLKKICDPQSLKGDSAPSRARKVINKGDILVSLTRPNLNAVALVPKQYDQQIASTGFEVIKPVLVDSRYIFTITRSKHFIDAISGAVQGALYPAAKSSDVQGYFFPLAPLAEQKVIADKLDILLAQVKSTKARLERIPQILKRFRQSVLAAAVSGKLTEEWRRGNCSEGYIYKFEELLKDKKHLSYGVLKPGDYDVNGVPMLRVMDLGEWGTFSDTEIFKVSKKLSDEFKRTIVDEGDIVLSIMATIGRPAIIPKELSGANVNRALAVIKLSDKVLSKFMLLQLLSPSFQEVFVSKQIGSAQKRINLADLREFDVWVPEINEQAEIVGRVEKLFAYTDTIEQQVQNALARVNNLTQSILAKAFRGELTEQWRKDNLGLISGDNSAEALLEKIKAEREALADQPKKRILAVKQKTGSTMSKGIIKVTEALRAANKPLTGQELMAAAGYPSNSSTEQLEQFFLDVRDALEANQIVKLKRDKNGQDWFSLNEATES